ncbi:MAG: ATP-dependent DNA helicase [Thermoanaerobaculaceae bacterium]|nr:ATP-dependent DNA helicase [Thermoanaerobaculaceae bacterium]
MAVRIDLDTRQVTCSVHDLLPETLRPGLGGLGEGLARLSVGAELHRTVQAQRFAADARYASEVAVDAVFAVDGWTMRILGRADGLTRGDDGRPVVEEIKTLHFRTELHHPLAHERLERFRWQARLYGWCLFPDGGATVRLLLVDLGGDDHRVEEVPWSAREVEAYLRTRLHVLVAAEQARERTRATWRAAAAELPFPFALVRPVQAEAMAAVEEALGAGRHLLLAAPTGVGKTAAALHPALKLALATGRRVAFLTAKTLQQQLAVATLQAMQTGGWRSIQIRAKAKMCANREVVCHEDFCLHARDYGAKLAQRGVLPALLSGPPHLEPDRIFAVAHAAEVCPFEVSLALGNEASAVVCDYNYVFDPGIALFGLAAEGALEDTILVVDEAHNLVDRAREYFSPRLGRSAVREARRIVEGHRQKVCRDLDELLGGLDDLIAQEVAGAVGNREGSRRIDLDPAPLAELRLGLDALVAPYFTFKRNAELWLAKDPVVDVLLSLARVTDLLQDGGRELVPLVERSAGADPDERLRVFCLDAARFTGATIARSAGCVAMSATLEPFEFYRDLLGFDPDRTDAVSLPSPFPPENRLIVAVDEVDTTYRARPRWYGRIAELVAELAPPDRNGLVLFPSYAFLREVADRLVAPGHSVEVQRGGDSDQARRDVLARLRGGKPVLLLAVLGGVFAEGVDYPGEMLSEVIVVSPALPQVGPERELLKAYFDDRYERGFEYAYLVPGMTRVVQAAGRLIRSAEDRGVIALVCKRFLADPYRSLLPEEWTGGDPASLRRDDPAAAVRAFFLTLAERP